MQFAARFMFQAALLLHAAHDAKLYTWDMGFKVAVWSQARSSIN